MLCVGHSPFCDVQREITAFLVNRILLLISFGGFVRHTVIRFIN